MDEENRDLDYYRELWRPTLVIVLGILGVILFQYVFQPPSPGTWVYGILIVGALCWRGGWQYAKRQRQPVIRPAPEESGYPHSRKRREKENLLAPEEGGGGLP